MSSVTATIAVLQLIASILALVWIWNAKSYFSKKGENQATKEDVAEITKLVEDVQSAFRESLERLRSELAVDVEYARQVAARRVEVVDECMRFKKVIDVEVHEKVVYNKDLTEHKASDPPPKTIGIEFFGEPARQFMYFLRSRLPLIRDFRDPLDVMERKFNFLVDLNRRKPLMDTAEFTAAVKDLLCAIDDFAAAVARIRPSAA